MGKLFSMENPFFQGLYKAMECVLLSLVWIVFCIPLFTAGTSTAALYYTAQKCLKNERGYVCSCFWKSFKENFKTGTVLSLIFLLMYFVGITDISVLVYLKDEGMIAGNAAIIAFAVALFIVTLYAIWVFAALARFKNKWKQTMKNAVIFAATYWKTTLIITAALIFTALVIYIIPILIFIMPAVSIWLISAPVERVFRLYMSEEDKRLEDELNMEYHNDYEDAAGMEPEKKRKWVFFRKSSKKEESSAGVSYSAEKTAAAGIMKRKKEKKQ